MTNVPYVEQGHINENMCVQHIDVFISTHCVDGYGTNRSLLQYELGQWRT